MSSLIYIVVKSAKNSFLEMLKKPGKMIMYIFIILAILGMGILSIFTQVEAQDQIPMFWFTGIFFIFLTLFVVVSIVKSLSNGDNIFEMNDVNFLFVSPISPRKILIYGILRLTKVSFLAGFFILFQSNSLRIFGIQFGGLIIILLGFMQAIVILSVLSLILYNLTNGNPRYKLFVKLIASLLFLPLIIFLVVQLINKQDIVLALEASIKSSFMAFIPVAGWTAASITYFLSGELFKGAVFLAINLIFGIGLVLYLLLSKIDYYEDTLIATETVFEKKRAQAEGNITMAQSDKRKIKISSTGISGSFASAIFYKHLRESFRQNRLGFLNLTSILVILGAILMSMLIKDLITVLQILMWMEIFLIATGRGLQETYMHYIYLIPASSFKKIIWSNMELIFKTFIESILIFAIGGMLIKANIFIILGTISTYTLFSFLLIGVNYLSMRYTGADISVGLLITIYYIAIILIMAPGVIVAMVVGFSIGGVNGTIIGLSILSVWELAAGTACFGLSKGVLHNCDISVGKPKN